MSGIEAAGLVLAAIPLILEAFDRSERTFEFFRTCGKYAKELTKIESILGAQKLFFRHNCVHLISAITSDPQRAQNMVNTATGENVDWASLVTVNPISSRLTSTLETVQTCQGTILLIQDSLQSIAREVEGFQADIGPGRNANRDRDWYRDMRQRIKLGVRKPRLDRRINELREFNRDFDLMCSQVIKGLATPARQSGQRRISQSRVAEFYNIRLASLELYQTLVNTWGCRSHPSHNAQISVSTADTQRPRIAYWQPSASVNLVRFEFKMSSKTAQDTPIWLAIDSVLEDPYYKSMTGTSTDVISSPGAQKDGIDSGKASKRVRFEEDIAAPPQTHSSDRESAEVNTAPSLQDLQDPCQYFKCHEERSQELCIGWLAQRNCTYRFYKSTAATNQMADSMSLANIIAWLAEDSLAHDLPREARFRVASSLSTTVLQFHSTPWLRETWRSKDIFFDNVRGCESNIQWASPYLNADVPETSTNKQRFGVRDSSPLSDEAVIPDLEGINLQSFRRTMTQDVASKFARNKFLFRLGIVLLGLGFAKPWSSLRASALTMPSNAQKSDYHLAETLAHRLVTIMGPSYSRIIRKCIGCDFGLGESDLQSEELQESFLFEVIVALQDLADEIAKLPSS